MTQIKIFVIDEKYVNEWLANNKNIKVIDIKRNYFCDYFYDGNICNQWIETMIIYEEE